MAPSVSILQLDTGFPRVSGDVACPETYMEAVDVIRVRAATVSRIVSHKPQDIDIAPFEQAVQAAKGDVIVTSCGFLSYWQDHLAALTSKPFVSSALTALPRLSEAHAPGEVLILTFDEDSLTPAHLGAARAYAPGIVGLPKKMHLRQVIASDSAMLDTDRARDELAAFIASEQTPNHRHLLLECTNLPPYKSALRSATGLEVTDILTLIEDARPGTVRPDHL
ncbi:aspartate/glutamate racemase family protein [uncultured Tateyamaria sp.]|uniref:aspartate/glutamate racemase family protein n=1 Tax=uncultured Tateyamaria sp. TaxID=455651 RepID=UPI002617DAC3|nr:aspartate/glutamate racemase family protein [uncultured Tateyamaria sp.]